MKQFIIQEHITYDSILKYISMQALYCKRVYSLLVSGYSFLEVSTPLPVVLYRKRQKIVSIYLRVNYLKHVSENVSLCSQTDYWEPHNSSSTLCPHHPFLLHCLK